MIVKSNSKNDIMINITMVCNISKVKRQLIAVNNTTAAIDTTMA